MSPRKREREVWEDFPKLPRTSRNKCTRVFPRGIWINSMAGDFRCQTSDGLNGLKTLPARFFWKNNSRTTVKTEPPISLRFYLSPLGSRTINFSFRIEETDTRFISLSKNIFWLYPVMLAINKYFENDSSRDPLRRKKLSFLFCSVLKKQSQSP